jgi:toxin FitB
MYLIDSNIVIYSYLPQYEYLRNLFAAEPVFVSEISRVEVLGYHKITGKEESYFKDVFNLVPIILPSQEIFDIAIDLRKKFNLSLGDSLIAATAKANDLTIYTRNLGDFIKLPEIKCINPLR